MSTWIMGELLYKDHECELDADYFEFLEDAVFSQAVITESAASCMLNSFAASALGTIYLDTVKVNEFWNVAGLKMDTTTLAPNIPLF